MAKFTELIKSEISCWKPLEIGFLAFVLVFICINSFFVNDHPAAIISAIFGILYTVFAGKGKAICFIFGLVGSGCYAYISYQNALWGNLLLYLCYYIPMEIMGIFQWNKNLKQNKNEILKTKLSKKEFIYISVFTVISTIFTIFVLYHFNDSSPVIDGITTIFSITGMYLTVKRCIEQWIAWIIVNGLCSLMWLNLVLFSQAQAYSTVIMWCVYFIFALYFFHTWKKEVNF